jgi:hypothetical protein
MNGGGGRKGVGRFDGCGGSAGDQQHETGGHGCAAGRPVADPGPPAVFSEDGGGIDPAAVVVPAVASPAEMVAGAG